MARTRPSAATRLSLRPAIAWILQKTRSFPSPAHAGFGFYIYWPGDSVLRLVFRQVKTGRERA